MSVSNDTRGWILTAISGLACVFGASFICIDLIIRLFPSKRNFKIQDSNGFLSCSLSLSAGVMLFSSLYKLLPESQDSLTKGGHSSRASAWILIACFLAGVWGIQIISKLLHMFMPSHVVDCDHTHEGDAEDPKSRRHSHSHANGHGQLETTPLLSRPPDLEEASPRSDSTVQMREVRAPPPLDMGTYHKPSLSTRMTRKMTSLVSGEKDQCDHEGPCKGFSNPCSPECFRNINARGGTRAPAVMSRTFTARSSLNKSPSTTFKLSTSSYASKTTDDIDPKGSSPMSDPHVTEQLQRSQTVSHSTTRSPSPEGSYASSTYAQPPKSTSAESQPHHHHVPQNAFLSLSFQTSVAIVLHKLPEGFITFASNHANPDLGFNVFMALAIHNITEGFCLALPIYLATSSRMKALLYSFILGGFSQPLGAAIAAAWLAIAERGKGEYAPDESVYGCLFAITAGILANVALNLLSQSFELSHNKGLVMFFVFVGMGVLGCSSALTA